MCIIGFLRASEIKGEKNLPILKENLETTLEKFNLETSPSSDQLSWS